MQCVDMEIVVANYYFFPLGNIMATYCIYALLITCILRHNNIIILWRHILCNLAVA